MKQITIGTRASKLAMTQTQWVVERLRQQWPSLDVSIEQIRTTGDRVTQVPLSQIGGDGVFVLEIERALQERRIDLAVHSLKDLPTQQPDGLRLVVTGPREDVRDVLITNTALHLHQDKLQAMYRETKTPLCIGTSSLRRTAQLREFYPNADIHSIRGNVDTRLRKLDAGEYDAIVLAAAGLHRLHLQEGLVSRMTYLPTEVMMPAPGQGALALEIRDEPELRDLLAPLHDTNVQAETSAERMFMRRLGAGCYLPVAAHGTITGEVFTLCGLVISLDGKRRVAVQHSIPWTTETTNTHAERLGVSLAEEALMQGAYAIVHEIDAIREQEQLHV
ncbi:MAG: hydroxymethylbilane synthase [Ktedonobacteraceae bacterium]